MIKNLFFVMMVLNLHGVYASYSDDLVAVNKAKKQRGEVIG